MASKKKTTLPSAGKRQNDSSAVYKVMIALFALCVGLLELRALRRFYATIAGLERLWNPPLLLALSLGCFVLSLGCAAAWLFWKKPVPRAIFPWLAFLFAMGGYTAASMKLEYTDGFYTVYFLWAIVLVQYIIYQLYRWEFFLFSLPTVSAGFLFFQLRAGFTPTLRTLTPLIIAAVSLLCTVLIAAITSRNKGCLVFGEKRVRVFSKKYEPLLHYVVVILWLICIPAALVLGSLFAFYCMFAAIAVEFIAAVYYTFQLN